MAILNVTLQSCNPTRPLQHSRRYSSLQDFWLMELKFYLSSLPWRCYGPSHAIIALHPIIIVSTSIINTGCRMKLRAEHVQTFELKFSSQRASLNVVKRTANWINMNKWWSSQRKFWQRMCKNDEHHFILNNYSKCDLCLYIWRVYVSVQGSLLISYLEAVQSQANYGVTRVQRCAVSRPSQEPERIWATRASCIRWAQFWDIAPCAADGTISGMIVFHDKQRTPLYWALRNGGNCKLKNWPIFSLWRPCPNFHLNEFGT